MKKILLSASVMLAGAFCFGSEPLKFEVGNWGLNYTYALNPGYYYAETEFPGVNWGIQIWTGVRVQTPTPCWQYTLAGFRGKGDGSGVYSYLYNSQRNGEPDHVLVLFLSYGIPLRFSTVHTPYGYWDVNYKTPMGNWTAFVATPPEGTTWSVWLVNFYPNSTPGMGVYCIDYGWGTTQADLPNMPSYAPWWCQ